MQLSGQRSVPQIFIGKTHVGGFTDSTTSSREGGLDELLNLNPQQENKMSEELQPVFSIERLYVKNVQVPHAPQIFLERGEPEVDMRVFHLNGQKLEDSYYNVDVTVTVTASG